MASSRYTSISRKNLGTPTPTMSNKRHGSRSLKSDEPRTYRSKTPQPGGHRSKPKKPRTRGTKSPRRLIKYRARNSEPQKEIEEELPDYIKATTPQPHSFNMKKPRTNNKNKNELMMPPISLNSLSRSKSGNNLHPNDTSPHDHIPQFSPNLPRDNSMFTFVKSQFEPEMGFNINPNSIQNRNRINSNSASSTSMHSNYNNYTNLSPSGHNNGYHAVVPTIPIIMSNSNNTTPIPLVHVKFFY